MEEARALCAGGYRCPSCRASRACGNARDVARAMACEATDLVRCDECAHVCELRCILFVRGAISELLEEIDKLRAQGTERGSAQGGET